MNEIIHIEGLKEVTISSTAEAIHERDTLLVSTRHVTTIKSGTDLSLAVDILKDLKAFTRSIETARAAVKAPVLEQGKRIDSLAKELTAKVDAEAVRISQVIGVWQAEQNRIAEEARRKAWEEEQRIRKEQERIAWEEEEKKRKEREELLLKESRARTETKAQEYAEKAKALEEQHRKEQEARDFEAEQQIIASRVAAAAIAQPKPQGVAIRREIRFEITNITELYEAAPYLVNLTPNQSAIKSALKGLQKGQNLPGVRHWEEATTIVR